MRNYKQITKRNVLAAAASGLQLFSSELRHLRRNPRAVPLNPSARPGKRKRKAEKRERQTGAADVLLSFGSYLRVLCCVVSCVNAERVNLGGVRFVALALFLPLHR